VIHSYSPYTNFAAWWATLGTKIIAAGALQSEFSEMMKETGPWLGRLSARWPRTQIFNSVAAAEHVRRSKGLFVPRRLYVVRNGVDLQHFRDAPLSTTGQACILSVGSLLPVKRWDRLLGAVLSLKRQGFDFLARLVGDGPLREPLQQQAQALGIADCVEFMGYRDDIPDLLADATFLVHTSDSEGCPNVVMEAMACGRAVVATDVGDTPSLVEDQKTGFVVPRGDDAALVERMTTLIADRELCHRMGRAGRLKAEQVFGLDRLVSETLAAYRAAGWKDS
jgi:glycosyltransferase involved in cell wall biosynthesis